MHPSLTKSKGKENPKYKEAVRLFGSTSLTRKEICLRCNLSVSAFNAHLQKYHRDLLFQRYGEKTSTDGNARSKIKEKYGQSFFSRKKYQKAIEACCNENYITYNISEIAKYFKLSPTGLGNQLRAHYPDILARRYKEQMRRGIPTHQQTALKVESDVQYAKAVALLSTTNYTIKEAAKLCQVSFTGLRQHVLFYHQDLVLQRRRRREKNKGQQRMGMQTGSNTIHEPKPATVKKYAEALELYRTTSLSLKDIADKSKITCSGFAYYLRTWHKDLIVKRRASTHRHFGETENLNANKHYLVSTAAKYAKAITYMKSHDVSTASVARRFSLHPECFRMYLKEHEPKIAAWQGMITTSNGRHMLRRSYEKYKQAIYLYTTTNESVNDIAKKLHLHPSSLRSFLKRHLMSEEGVGMNEE